MSPIRNYIGGVGVDATSNRWLDNIEPATGKVYCRLPDSDADDIETAVNAAAKAFPRWSSASGDDRALALSKLADWVESHSSELAAAESQDAGKTIRQAAEVEIPRAVANLRFFAAMAKTFASESHATSEAVNYTLRQPLGVVGCISPWNLPLYLFTWKVAPALAAGNCVVGKPSELTPMTAAMLGQGSIDCGFPPGVLNIVQGQGSRAGQALVEHPGIRAISFTGGTQTGLHIAQQTASSFKKLSLELGGKNPNIVFADADYERMLATTIRSSFANQGQICLCGSRVYVQQPIFQRLVDDLVTRAKKLRVGDPRDPQNDLGAVVSGGHMHKILGCLQRARQEGGEVLCGGHRLRPPGRCEDGFFVEPTVIVGLPSECQTNQEEIFGPAVTVQPFVDAEEAIALANSTNYGLSASVWTENLTVAHRVAQQIAAGVVWINCWLLRDLRTPFGGVRQSGVGREGGVEAMRFFTETKNVCVFHG